jgi:uncharacterized ubiquitin-like protein YukD
MTQQIYTATEMGGQSCQISSVSFFNTGYSSTRNLDVYIVHTDKTSFESNTDWITVTENDKVFSGRVTMTGYNWANIYFATPFDYDGSSNVALIVDDNTNSWNSSSIGFRVFNTIENQSIYICSSNTNYDPYNPTGYAGTLMLEKNQVVFGYARYDYTVTVTANPSEGGMVSGGEGLHYYGEPVTLTATPNEGYVFSKWTKNGSVVSYLSTYSVQVTGNVEYVANFQQMDGIAIGEATYTNSYLPIYSSYMYSMSQQIYTADELNTGACEISSVSFFNTYYGETRNLNIFMVNTDKTAFESSTDWITLTEADLVFSGSVTTTYYNWTTIYFNTPFNYDGSSNVALVVNDWTGDWGWGTSCRTFDTESTQAIYVYRDYDVINPYNLSDCNGTLLTVKNQIVLTIPNYEYTVTLTADPEEAGTVSGGGGLYFYGQPIPVSATPNEGYAFNYWTKYNGYYGYDEVLSYYSTDNIPVTETTEFVAHFQQMDGITVGNASHSSYCLPTCSDYPYSMTQQIYTADELSFGSSSISSISFFNTGYYSYRYLSIYLVNTDKTVFEDSWDWIAVNYDNQVFSGGVYFEESAWTTINFYMPFQYDGSSNLALVVCDETGDWGWGMSCRTFDSEGTQTLYTVDWYGGYIDPYYPYNCYGTLMSEKNEVVFGASSYMVTVSANPEEGGTVSGGGGPYDYGEYVAISATANPDYVFNYWSRYDEYYGYYETVSYFSTDTISVIGSSEYIAYFQQADGIIIGDAVSSSSYLPTSSYYSMTQQIFTASEMGDEEQAISSVSFFNMSSSKTRNLDIYMVNTNKTSFENNTDWITVTEDDKVFSGNVSMTGYGWVTIYFTTPFYYDGLSNVALIVDDNTNSSSYGYYRTFGTEVCQAIRVSGTGTDYDPCNPSGYMGTLMSQKNQVVFGIASFEYMASVSASPAEGGTVSGGGGPYYYGQPIPVTATANSGYVFNKWTKNGSAVSYFSTDNVSVTETAEFVANFQQVEGIAIGEAVSDNTYLPTSSYYSMTQQIFTADEMGDEEHEISSVSFFNTSNSKTRNLDIYMVNTNKTSFESNTDWITVTEDDKVFSGNVSISATGWATIYFATPFNYDGVSNVALIVDDNSNTYNSGLKCRTFGTEDSQAIRIASSGTNYDPYNPSSYTGTLMWEKNQVIFGFPHYEYMVTATSESTESGTVNGGGGPYYYGQPITLTAIANDGYAFVNWTKDGTVVSYLSPFTVAVTESAEYVAHFQEINGFVIGDATGTNSCLPSYSYYCYSLSQQIYTADELNLGAGKISSVAFFNTGTTRSRNYTIYMVSTNKDSFNDYSDWITVTAADKVFTGNVTMMSGSWTTIPFDKTFNYDGVSNIALVIDDNTGNYYYPYMYCRVYSTDCNQSIYVYSDDTNYNPLYPTSYYGTRPLVKNQIVLGMMYNITVASDPMEGGSVMGGGFCQKGSTCTVTATPAENYYFFYWTENGQTVSFDNIYSFTVGSGRNLVAHFEQVTNNHWTFDDSGYSDNMTLTGIIQIDGVEQRSELLEIGAFCGDECRGSQRATYFAPTDRYIIQMVVFGESNDVISFRLYDHQQQQELLLSPPADVTFNTNGYGSLSNPYVLNFTSTVTHTQALNSGWNWWSTYIELTNNDGLSQLENSIGSAGIIIKSRTNGYVETYEYNGETNWYGTLTSINNEQMYMIRTNAVCNAIVEGWLTNPADHPITINNGWNWIGFPCNQNVSVDEAMSGFTPENNDIIKSRNGYSTYYSDGNYNMWYGTLNTLESGKGYMYRSNSATQKTLVFTAGRGDGYEDNITPENNAFRPADGDFADNMTLTAVVEMDGEELRSEDYELAAFVGDECRGSVRLMYVEPIDRYIAFLTIFGEQDEELYFQLTDGIAGSLASDQMAFAADGIVGTLDNPFVMHFGTLDVDESALANVKVYPNPSEGIFNIEGQNIRKVEVFNAFGQSVYSKETENGFMKLDLTNRAAGIYLIRIVTNDGILNHQIIKK